MQLEPVEWPDPAFERRVGPLDLAASHALYELFYRLCVEGGVDLGIGTIAARGCWWTWLATTPSDPHVAEVVARLALRTLTPAEEEHAVVAVMREMTSSHIEHVAGVVVARRYGLRYAVPLERFYVLGTMISCAIDVLERQGH